MRYISASIVIPVKGNFMRKGVVAIDKTGMIKGVYEEADPAVSSVKKEFYDGVLIPGFVNAHCHIELSHMSGKTKKGTGLPRFLADVMKQREAKEKDILAKIAAGGDSMLHNGIQGVGEHVHTEVSAKIKSNSRIKHHTLVDIMSMTTDALQVRVDKARDIEFCCDANHASITPHAP